MTQPDDEPESVTVEIDLDPAHARMIHFLSENGIDVGSLLSERLRPVGEKEIHNLLMEFKYGD